MLKILILIPVYGGARFLPALLKKIPQEVLRDSAKIAVVDDGSPDNVIQTLKSLEKSYNIILIKHPRNLGYGAAQKSGYRFALLNNFDITVLLHQDGQYLPEMIPELIEPIKTGKADIVCGSRILWGSMLTQGMPFIRYLGKMILTKLANFVLGANLTTYHSGFRAYSKNALKLINFEKFSNYFEFDSEILTVALKKRLMIKEIPIPTLYYKERPSGVNLLKYGLRVLKVIFKSAVNFYDKY